MTETNEKKSCHLCGFFKEMLKNPKAGWIVAGSIIAILLISGIFHGIGRRGDDNRGFDRQGMMQGRAGFNKGNFGPGQKGARCDNGSCPFVNQTGDQQPLSGEQIVPQQTGVAN